MEIFSAEVTASEGKCLFCLFTNWGFAPIDRPVNGG